MKYLVIPIFVVLTLSAKAQNELIQIYWVVGDTIDLFEKQTLNLFDNFSDDDFVSAYFSMKNDSTVVVKVKKFQSGEKEIVFSEADLKIYNTSIEVTINSDNAIRKETVKHNKPKKTTPLNKTEKKKVLIGSSFIITGPVIAFYAILWVFTDVATTLPLIAFFSGAALIPVGIILVVDGIIKHNRRKKQKAHS